MTPVAYVARVLKGRSAGGRRLAIVMCEMICVGTVAGVGGVEQEPWDCQQDWDSIPFQGCNNNDIK